MPLLSRILLLVAATSSSFLAYGQADSMFDVQTAIGARYEKSKDFKSQDASSRIAEIDLRAHVHLGSWPVSLGYYFKMPVADLGSDDVGVKEAFFFRNGVDLEVWWDTPSLPVIPYASIGYTFYGLTTVKANSELKGTSGKNYFELPAGDISMRYTMTGTALDMGARYALTGKYIYFGLSFISEEKHLESFLFNKTDQKVLFKDLVEGTPTFARKYLIGLHWDI